MPLCVVKQDRKIIAELREYISANDIDLVIYSDADFGGDTDTNRSTSGYVTFYKGVLLSWRSKRQSKISTSTAISEFYALNSAAKEAIYLKRIISEVTGKQCNAIVLGDNQSSLKQAEAARFSDKSKHVRIAASYIHEMVSNGELHLKYIPTTSNLADLFTKGLERIVFTRLRDAIMNGRTSDILSEHELTIRDNSSANSLGGGGAADE